MVFVSWEYYIFSRFFKIVNRDEFRIWLFLMLDYCNINMFIFWSNRGIFIKIFFGIFIFVKYNENEEELFFVINNNDVVE